MKKQNPYIGQIEKFLNFLKTLSEEETIKLEEDILSIQFNLIERKGNSKKNGKKEEISVEEVIAADVINYLNNLDNREIGLKYLETTNVPKKKLEEIIKILDLPITKKDNVEKLKNKIIE